MIRVLLVDDDDDFRSLIARSLRAYRVDEARSYDEALDLLRRGVPYDVAIVDLNLLDGWLDQLGMDLLGELQADYPSIPRIALTGQRLGAVGDLIGEYGLADLLFKNEMTLAEARRVLRRVLANVAGELSLELRDSRGALWDEVSKWRDDMLRDLDRSAKTFENDLRSAAPEASERGRASAASLASLEARRAAFERNWSAMAAGVASIRTAADLADAAGRFTELQARCAGERSRPAVTGGTSPPDAGGGVIPGRDR